MDFCSFAVNPSYVKDTLKDNHLLLEMSKDTVPIGFIIAKYTADGGIYLDVICAKEKGQQLLHFFIELCQHTLHVVYIELSSIMNVLAFYPRYGFQHRRDCGAGPITGMSPEFASYLKEKTIHGNFKEQDDFYNDPYVLQYLTELHKRGLTQTKEPKVCRRKTLSGLRFRQYKCARDGFVMRKCFGNARGTNEIIPMIPFEKNITSEVEEETKVDTLLPILSRIQTRSQIRNRNRNRTTKRAPKSLQKLLTGYGTGYGTSYGTSYGTKKE